MKIGILGDIHLHLSQFDIEYLNQSDYDQILIVGDLCQLVSRPKIKQMATLLAGLTKPAVYIPGNHDAYSLAQFWAELKGHDRVSELNGSAHVRHHHKIDRTLGSVKMGSYSVHTAQSSAQTVDIIAARPYSMGGPTLNFRPFMRRMFGVTTLEESAARLKQCVDQSQHERLIFLAHNGPAGLGDQPTDIWGCDFKPEGGDWGDPDLEEAITYARSIGKQVVAVIGGHMHQKTVSLSERGKQGGPIKHFGGPLRAWHLEKDSTHFINAARVPRIFTKNEQTFHHHVTLELLADGSCSVEAKLVALNMA